MKRFLLSLALVLCPVIAFAQGVTTGAMSGNVYSLEGEAVPGVRVVAKHLPSGTVYGAVSNSSGRFTFPALRIGGPYQVTATKLGLRPDVSDGISIQLGKTFNLAIVMVDETVKLSDVVVTAKKNAILNSERSGAATNISKDLIQQMPTLSRSIGDFTRATPQANGLSFGGQDARFINFTVDGSIFNNNFGLASLPGGQTNSTPVSLDAIEELQINLAPYDVRQSGFVGAGINAVTRRGDNDYKASAYFYTRNEGLLGKTADTNIINRGLFNVKQIGFRVGGPIIKDKLFFFLNAEQETRTDPGTAFTASTRELRTGSNVVRGDLQSGANYILADSLNQLRDFLIQRFGYDPGLYQDYNLETYSAKVAARFDWNIDESQKFGIRFNYLQSYRDIPMSSSGGVNGRNGNLFAMNFSNSNYRINNNIYSVIAEYNATFGTEWSVNAQAGFTANRDFRELFGAVRMPTVDILSAGRNVTSFGDEPFTPNNVLNTDTYQAQLNVTRYLGEHVITAGFNLEAFGFENGFTPEISSVYQFQSFGDFYAAVNNTRPVTLQSYRQWFSQLPGGTVPVAKTRAQQIGFYLQDEWNVHRNLKITAGVRGDIQSFAGTDALVNPEVAGGVGRRTDGRDTTFPGFTFADGNRYSTGTLPASKLLLAPRVGFNWDAFGDRTLQVRGGTGIFTGRVPFVIISNQVSNNGVYNGTVSITNARLGTGASPIPGGGTLAWSPNADPFTNPNRPTINNSPNLTPAPSYNLALTANNFQYPQVWRSNFAADLDLGKLSPALEGTLLTVEGIYSQNIAAVIYSNANLNNPALVSGAENRFSGADNRVRFQGSAGTNVATGAAGADNLNRGIFKVTDAILLNTTDQGDSYTLTTQLQKTFDFGLYAMVAYTHGRARDLGSFGSIAFSSWRDNINVNGNNRPDLSFSTNDLRHRVIAQLNYRLDWSKVLGDIGKNIGYTTISLFYQGQTQDRYTYIITGDVNGDGLVANDLMFVPADQSQINFVPLTIGSGSTARTFTAADQWNALNGFIGRDENLNDARGQYFQRNGGLRPWLHRIDLALSHEFAIDFGGYQQRLQFRADIFNFGNMLNSKWGVADVVNNNAPLQFAGVTAGNQPQYRLNGASIGADGNLTLPVSPYRPGSFISDVWQLQVGIRYFFNDK